MTGASIVHLIRHGEVVNPDKLMYGRLPGFPLSDHGRRHVQAATERFRDRPISLVVASPLERARETGQIFATVLDVPFRTDDRLIEGWDRFEGRKFSDRLVLRRPADWRFFLNPWRPTWGEPYPAVAARMAAAVGDARRSAGDGDGEVICVSHELPIYTVRRFFEGRRVHHLPSDREAAYVSTTSVHFDGDTVVRVSYQELPASYRGDPAGGHEEGQGACAG